MTFHVSPFKFLLEQVLEIRLFGVMDVRVEGVPSSLRLRKAQWLLALLALRAGREVNRDWLAATLWPDHDPVRARRNLRQCLSTDLRPALGRASDCLSAPTPDTVLLDLDPLCVDVGAFDAALADGSVAALERAAALYRGPLLEDCPEEWILAERTAREQDFLSALERLAQAAEQGGPSQSVGYLRRLLTADPLRESAATALMQALADCGDYAAVLQVYRDLRLLLHRELNAAPSAQTQALYHHLQQQQQKTPFLPPAPPRRRAVCRYR